MKEQQVAQPLSRAVHWRTFLSAPLGLGLGGCQTADDPSLPRNKEKMQNFKAFLSSLSLTGRLSHEVDCPL